MSSSSGKIKVLHVLGSLNAGGCETLCLQLLRAHDRSRFVPELVLLSSGGGVLAEEFAKVPGLSIHECLHRSGESVSFLLRFRILCRKLRPDVVLSYAFGLHSLIAIAARSAGVGKVLVTVQNPAPSEPKVRRRTAWLAQLARPFCTGEVAATAYVARDLEHVYGLPRKRLRVIHNGCDVRQVHDRAVKVRTANRTSPWPAIGMVARLDPIKDHPTLIRSVANLRSTFPDIGLTLVGDGSRRTELEELARDLNLSSRVRFLGSRADVPEQLGGMDLFAFSTTANEGFGIALIEALAAAVPVVATDVGACREVLDSGKLGLLVPAGDPDALAQGIGLLLNDEGLRNRLACEGYARALERYDIRKTAAAYETLFAA